MGGPARIEASETPSPAEKPGASGFRWLNRTVLGIGLASLCSDVGHEMATAAMPAFLTALGSSSLLLGLIEGVSDGVSSFAKLYSGVYSDRLRRRKPLAVVGYFLTASGMASFALATHGWHVLVGRAVGWLGRGARSPVKNVLLTEATTKETYGRAFGLERAMDSAGAVIGPLIALGIVHQTGVRSVFAYTFVPGILAALLIATLVREKPHEPQPHARLLSGMRALPPRYRRFLWGVGVAGLGDFSNTLLILWATQAWTVRFGTARAAALAMAFYVGYNVVYTISCYVSGTLADHLPKRGLLAGGYALAVIPALALLLPGISLIKFGVVFAVSGLYMGVWETVESSTAAEYLPPQVRGVGFGTLATVNGVGDLASSILVGALWFASPVIAMSYVIATSLVGAAIIATTPVSELGSREGKETTGDDMTNSPRVTICGATDVGRIREHNEDTHLVADLASGNLLGSAGEKTFSLSSRGLLLMVSDGMGGAAAGEVAARLSGESVMRALMGGREAVSTSPAESLMSALEIANQAIFDESRRRDDERGMGTTCTAALLFPNRLVLAQVGDSRAYLFRNGTLKQLTRDQSLAAAMVEAGALPAEEVRDFAHSNVILQALGIQETVAPVASEIEPKTGDVVLLSSDGLHGPVPDEKIADVLAKTASLAASAQALIQAALEAGGPDNVTVILARYDLPS